MAQKAAANALAFLGLSPFACRSNALPKMSIMAAVSIHAVYFLKL